MTHYPNIRLRLDGIMLTGSPEDAYDSELIRYCALALEAGEKSAYLEAKQRLQAKFRKEFVTARFNALVQEKIISMKAEFKEELRAANPETDLIWQAALLRRMAKDDMPGETTGPLLLCEHNAVLYLECHPAWKEDGQPVLRYNEFTRENEVTGAVPPPVTMKLGESVQDFHDTQFAQWMQIETSLTWHVDMVRRAVDVWARKNSFHPVRAYLDKLIWDGVPRLASWLFDYAGAGPSEGSEDIDEELMKFYSAAGERWMISAIARIRMPGCEVHHMLVLEGGEGLGKSTLVKTIGKGWAQVMTGDLEGKDAQELIASAVWIWEFSELASLKKTSEVESAKAFITRPEDKFRPAYGHRVITHKRECAFIATVNGDQYLDSAAWEDGKRRVWPIRCTRPFDINGLRGIMDQLWAEADAKYASGQRWHFEAEEDKALIATAKDEQAARVPESTMQDEVIAAAERCTERGSGKFYDTASVAEVLAELKVPIDRRDLLALRIGRCFSSAGWRPEHLRRPEDGKQVKRYRRPLRGA